MKTVDLFIKSYGPDFWLLQLALKTITRNVTGYNNIILLIPEKDKHDFDTRVLPERTLVFYVRDEGDGWLRQQWFKMTAHKYSLANYIMFSDSDCFFDHPIDLQKFIAGDKPEILYTDWGNVGEAKCWKEPTEKFMKDSVDWEFMRRNCLIYHRSTLEAISVFQPELEKMIMTSKAFSEFNCIGAFAYKYERDKYDFINTEGWEYVNPKAMQVWSWGSKQPGADDLHLREYIRILETIMKCFDVPAPQ